MRSVAIVGASLAGLRAAETLRKEGFAGEVHLIGDEPDLPYDRPPLSKQVLAGEWEPDKASLVTADRICELDLTLHLGDSGVSLDVDRLRVTLKSGKCLDVDGVVVATGATPRTIDTTLDGVHTLRTLGDAAQIRARLADVDRLAVIGAGFIGSEVAATARSLGVDVALVEMAGAPCERVLGAEVGDVLSGLHREHGVDLRTGVGCENFLGETAVEQIELSDGSIIDADLVVVGIGVVANTGWLQDSGLKLENGVACDETLLAAPGVVAAGDVAQWPNALFDETMRVEHWDNAVTSGQHAAKRLLHGPSAGAYAPVPWFWSDQYDRKIQLAGRTANFDQFQIVTGDVESRRFAALYGRNGKLSAVFGMNRPRHLMKYRSMIADGVSWQDALEAEV